MQRLMLALGLVVVLSALVLAVVSPDLSIMLIAAVCVAGAVVALFMAITQTFEWISRRLAR
jgi:uncharacterized membrane protein YqgA involved in biofilm formation